MNRGKRFFWFCSGATIPILAIPACITEHNKYAAIGATIFLTAVLATVSGGYALFTVFQSYPHSMGFGILWGVLIFNLDRFIVMSMKKRKTGWINRLTEMLTASPRLLLAVLISFVITTPLELKIFDREIMKQIETKNIQILNEGRKNINQQYDEIYLLEEQNAKLMKEISKKDDKIYQSFLETQGEAEGTRGTGKRGLGSVWKQKKDYFDKLTKEFDELRLTNNVQISKNTS